MQSIQRTALLIGFVSLLGTAALAGSPPEGGQHAAKSQKPEPKPPEKKPEPKPDAPKKVGIGEEVDGALALTDTDTKPHALHDYRGKLLVLVAWSIDAAPCKQYQARLKKLNDDYASKNAVVIAFDPNSSEVDAGTEPYKRIKEASSKTPLGVPLMVDVGDKLTDRLGATMTPEVFVIDAKGVLRYKGAIDDDPTGEKGDKANGYARKALDELIAGKPVTTASTPPNGTAITHGAAPKPPEPPKKKPDDKPAPKKPDDKSNPPKKKG